MRITLRLLFQTSITKRMICIFEMIWLVVVVVALCIFVAKRITKKKEERKV